MSKNIIGVALITILAVILMINTFQPKEKASNETDVTGDTNVNGVAISAPNQGGIEQGEEAPDFELETIEGETIRLSDLRGSKVLLNFWASWCGPCRKEMPEMQQFHEEHGDDIEILAVNLTNTENKETDVHKFLEENGFTFPVVLDRDMAVGETYMAVPLPTSYFIGTDGVVQLPKKVGPMTYEFMEEMLEKLN